MIDRWPQYRNRPHYVYRAYDATDTLLYVGCTIDFHKRQAEHGQKSRWAGRAVRWDVDRYDDQTSALVAEENAIKDESPRFNRMYNGAGLTGWNDRRRASETCLHGHPWSENAAINAQGMRICTECKRDAQYRYDAKRRGYAPDRKRDGGRYGHLSPAEQAS